ncbi:hypothetical protein M406DRAFT_72144 [Cryphonectria parasitica EP155]|uniref:BZIP domain-containing protein n=1 Tax=Cryphonectria parasitica (strain ATCC 38755 / EP155) TaxID=660469 RepID=A0A9P5CT14_CRYP1|nr:uncharacterized protein M406DRAFT_72144 [Cryphonectria parasitica EP155]KAF3769202.1 hypothetical protein M406DRAFT_72144 [Cryphonectria parasitica EP155]
MGSPVQMQNYYSNSEVTLDTAQTPQRLFEDDDCVLDDNVLDQTSMDSSLEMSPTLVDSRRESFAVSTSMFSPKPEAWSAVEMESVPSNNPFMEHQHPQSQPQPQNHSNNPFLRLDQQQQPQPFISQPTNPWSMHSPGACTPMVQYDGVPSEYDANGAPLFQQRPQMHGQGAFINSANHVPLFPPPINSQPMQQSTSKDGWMSTVKDGKHNSPTIRSHNELRRGDGIRKKNARFDIPAERTLNNIDHLIAQSNDEAEIKELKQQKRLLRNRQAALDSRQRKKLHTERLEEEKKHFTGIINDMETEIEQLRGQLDQMFRERQQDLQIVEQLKFEKEEMVRTHTIETGELRKKVSVLTSHVQSLEGAAVSQGGGLPSQAYANGGHFETDMDDIAMDGPDGPWESIGLFGAEFPMEEPEVKQEMQVVPAKKQEVALAADSEKSSAQGGLLFMLFLVGAFVLSNRQPSIPRVSDDVRAASATLLENVLKDAGVSQPASANLDATASQPTGTTWAAAPTASVPALGCGLDGGVSSVLGDLSDSLTRPTQEQQNEQLFGLTAAQYDVVQSQDFLQNAPAEKPTGPGRRNLAQALASMKSNGKAEVYTRSLLWDQIPGDVVRTFAKMVIESNTREGDADADADADADGDIFVETAHVAATT